MYAKHIASRKIHGYSYWSSLVESLFHMQLWKALCIILKYDRMPTWASCWEINKLYFKNRRVLPWFAKFLFHLSPAFLAVSMNTLSIIRKHSKNRDFSQLVLSTHPLLLYQFLSFYQTFVVLSNSCHHGVLNFFSSGFTLVWFQFHRTFHRVKLSAGLCSIQTVNFLRMNNLSITFSLDQ